MGASIYLGKVLSAGTKGCNIILPTVASYDPDAQAFFTAAGITDSTQKTAINTLVTDLKGYGVWTKMKALYPMVGGTATTMKWNLKDPRDLDIAFRLLFIGGGTWDANGYTPNGSNGYANTKLTPSTTLTQLNTHLSFYSRTNSIAADRVAIGSTNSPSYTMAHQLILKWSDGKSYGLIDNNNSVSFTNTNSSGFYVLSRTANNSLKTYKNNSIAATLTTTITAVANTSEIYIGARNETGSLAQLFDDKQIAFGSIGDGLTDTEAANYYTAVQTFQTTLGRSIGTQTVSDADAQAFVTNAGIVDQVEANAINNLVIGMKADGLWAKMKAVYPMVGGSSSTMKYNLKNPLDTDAAFRLQFNGGWTFSSNGALPNGTNAYAETKLTPSTSLTLNNASLSFYSRTNNTTSLGVEIGARIFSPSSSDLSLGIYSTNPLTGRINTYADAASLSVIDSLGFYQITRIGGSTQKVFKNTLNNIGNITISTPAVNIPIYIGCMNNSGVAQFFSNRQCAFASIGDGLTDTDATNLNTRVNTFQTALGRQV